ncbi:MAG: helix-turn-helix domain-containing protein [Labedaea sp.]
MTESIHAPHPAGPAVANLLTRGYLAFGQPAGTRQRWLATPTGTVTAILNLGAAFGGLPGSFVAGLTDTHGVVDQSGPIECFDLKLTPLGAYTLLGVPMGELANQVVDLRDLLPGVGALTERLANTPGWADRVRLLDAYLTDRAERGPRPAPELTFALRRLTETHGRCGVGALAGAVGWSRRHLVSRFRQQVGLAPKTLARVLRFEQLLRRLPAGGAGRFTELALACGYYDQAHMNRDFREFAGTTPTGYLARVVPAGTEVTSVQYSWVSAA